MGASSAPEAPSSARTRASAVRPPAERARGCLRIRQSPVFRSLAGSFWPPPRASAVAQVAIGSGLGRSRDRKKEKKDARTDPGAGGGGAPKPVLQREGYATMGSLPNFERELVRWGTMCACARGAVAGMGAEFAHVSERRFAGPPRRPRTRPRVAPTSMLLLGARLDSARAVSQTRMDGVDSQIPAREEAKRRA